MHDFIEFLAKTHHMPDALRGKNKYLLRARQADFNLFEGYF